MDEKTASIFDAETENLDHMLEELMGLENPPSAAETQIDLSNLEILGLSNGSIETVPSSGMPSGFMRGLNEPAAQRSGGNTPAENAADLPMGLMQYSLKTFLTSLNWRNNPAKVWPPKAQPAVATVSVTSGAWGYEEIPVPVGALGLKQFLKTVNWRNVKEGKPKLPTYQVEAEAVPMPDLAIDAVMSGFAWD